MDEFLCPTFIELNSTQAKDAFSFTNELFV